MPKRTISFLLRLNEAEHVRLMTDVRQTGLSREAYLRALISGYVPRPLPPAEYYEVLRELRAIGNNLNQIAAKAHATGHPDSAIFQREADDLRSAGRYGKPSLRRSQGADYRFFYPGWNRASWQRPRYGM